MVISPIPDVDQVTPEWLTHTLRAGGWLDKGEVAELEVDSADTIISTVLQLKVRYSPGASGSAPTRLFLKLSRPDTRPELGRQEVQFYNEVARAVPNAPFIHCYEAAYSEATGRSHLLLEDLSDTHSRPPWPLPPSVPHCEEAVDCLTAGVSILDRCLNVRYARPWLTG